MANAVPAETSFSSSIARCRGPHHLFRFSIDRRLERELRLQPVDERARRQSLGFKVYRLGKIGEDRGEFLLR